MGESRIISGLASLVRGKPATVKIPGIGGVAADRIPAIDSAAESYMAKIGRPGGHVITDYGGPVHMAGGGAYSADDDRALLESLSPGGPRYVSGDQPVSDPAMFDTVRKRYAEHPWKEGDAAVRSRDPSWRDGLSNTMLGDERASPELQHFVEGITGSTSLGGRGIGMIDMVPQLALSNTVKDIISPTETTPEGDAIGYGMLANALKSPVAGGLRAAGRFLTKPAGAAVAGTAAAGAAMAPDDANAMWLGQKALRAPLNLLDRAKGMLRDAEMSADPRFRDHTRFSSDGGDRRMGSLDAVRRDTGWLYGPDKKWRWEIEDPVNMDAHGYLQKDAGWTDKVGKVINHPELLENYPDLADMKLSFDPRSSERANGWYQGPPGSANEHIFMRSSGDPANETLLHEIQRAVQAREGFTPGMNTDMAGMKGAETLNKGIAGAQYMGGGPDAMRVVDQGEDIKRGVGGLSPAEREAYDFGLYRRDFGESEARATGSRRGWTMEDRMANPFSKTYDMHPNRLIVPDRPYAANFDPMQLLLDDIKSGREYVPGQQIGGDIQFRAAGGRVRHFWDGGDTGGDNGDGGMSSRSDAMSAMDRGGGYSPQVIDQGWQNINDMSGLWGTDWGNAGSYSSPSGAGGGYDGSDGYGDATGSLGAGWGSDAGSGSAGNQADTLGSALGNVGPASFGLDATTGAVPSASAPQNQSQEDTPARSYSMPGASVDLGSLATSNDIRSNYSFGREDQNTPTPETPQASFAYDAPAQDPELRSLMDKTNTLSRLQENALGEADNQGYTGMLGVSATGVNRAKSGYGNTGTDGSISSFGADNRNLRRDGSPDPSLDQAIANQLTSRAQYSWRDDPEANRRVRTDMVDPGLRQDSWNAAIDAYNGVDPTGGAVNYHTLDSHPDWANASERQGFADLGDHRFSGFVDTAESPYSRDVQTASLPDITPGTVQARPDLATIDPTPSVLGTALGYDNPATNYSMGVTKRAPALTTSNEKGYMEPSAQGWLSGEPNGVPSTNSFALMAQPTSYTGSPATALASNLAAGQAGVGSRPDDGTNDVVVSKAPQALSQVASTEMPTSPMLASADQMKKAGDWTERGIKTGIRGALGPIGMVDGLLSMAGLSPLDAMTSYARQHPGDPSQLASMQGDYGNNSGGTGFSSSPLSPATPQAPAAPAPAAPAAPVNTTITPSFSRQYVGLQGDPRTYGERGQQSMFLRRGGLAALRR